MSPAFVHRNTLYGCCPTGSHSRLHIDAPARVLTLSIHRVIPFPRWLSLKIFCQSNPIVANRCLSLPPTNPTNSSYPISSYFRGRTEQDGDVCGLPHTARVTGMFYEPPIKAMTPMLHDQAQKWMVPASRQLENGERLLQTPS